MELFLISQRHTEREREKETKRERERERETEREFNFVFDIHSHHDCITGRSRFCHGNVSVELNSEMAPKESPGVRSPHSSRGRLDVRANNHSD